MQVSASASAEDADDGGVPRSTEAQASGPGVAAPADAATGENGTNGHGHRGGLRPELGSMRGERAGRVSMTIGVEQNSGRIGSGATPPGSGPTNEGFKPTTALGPELEPQIQARANRVKIHNRTRMQSCPRAGTS